jgi:S-layer homology domain
MDGILMGSSVLLRHSWIALCVTSSLLLASCADSPLGQSLQKSLEADPKLQPSATPAPIASDSPAPSSPSVTPPATVTPGSITPGPMTPATASPQAPIADGLAAIKPFSDRLSLGLAGDASGVQAASPPLPPDANATRTFSDLDKTPISLRSYVEDVVQLGVLTPPSLPARSATSGTAPVPTFEPNKVITRRDYARWLVAVNNRLQSNQPAQQVRLGLATAQPAFQDVPRSDADFPVIQGLAEAGLLPSPLAGESTTVIFRPNEPLTREQLVLWKVPMDMRQVVPPATLDAVTQTWGFQDAARIEPKALRTVLADFQNGDLSNIRRVFGYTRLFQPKKPVTRAEAAAALWYFGFQGEGRSAATVLKAEKPSGSDP